MGSQTMTRRQYGDAVARMRRVLGKVAPTNGSYQQFLEEGGIPRFEYRLEALIRETMGFDPAREHVISSGFYHKDWVVPPLAVQVERLVEAIPALPRPTSLPKTLPPLGEGFEGWAILPKTDWLAQALGIPWGSGDTSHYHELLWAVMASEEYSLFERPSEPVKSMRISLSDERSMFYELDAEPASARRHDGWTIAKFNFGSLYEGYTRERAMRAASDQGNIVLTGVHVACLLIAMPDRLRDERGGGLALQWIDCPYDEMASAPTPSLQGYTDVEVVRKNVATVHIGSDKYLLRVYPRDYDRQQRIGETDSYCIVVAQHLTNA